MSLQRNFRGRGLILMLYWSRARNWGKNRSHLPSRDVVWVNSGRNFVTSTDVLVGRATVAVEFGRRIGHSVEPFWCAYSCRTSPSKRIAITFESLACGYSLYPEAIKSPSEEDLFVFTCLQKQLSAMRHVPKTIHTWCAICQKPHYNRMVLSKLLNHHQQPSIIDSVNGLYSEKGSRCFWTWLWISISFVVKLLHSVNVLSAEMHESHCKHAVVPMKNSIKRSTVLNEFEFDKHSLRVSREMPPWYNPHLKCILPTTQRRFSTLSPQRVIKFKFPLQPHQEW